MNVSCPRCNKGEFITKDHGSSAWVHCSQVCGMSHSYSSSNFRYCVRDYVIFWYWNGMCELWCEVWSAGWTHLYRGDYLPWDITDDEMRMLLVFQ